MCWELIALAMQAECQTYLQDGDWGMGRANAVAMDVYRKGGGGLRRGNSTRSCSWRRLSLADFLMPVDEMQVIPIQCTALVEQNQTEG